MNTSVPFTLTLITLLSPAATEPITVKLGLLTVIPVEEGLVIVITGATQGVCVRLIVLVSVPQGPFTVTRIVLEPAASISDALKLPLL